MDYITSRISSIAILDADATITIDGLHYEPLNAIARRLHMTRRTVYNWIDRGWLPHPVKLGSRVYFSCVAVNRHLAKIATAGKWHDKNAAEGGISAALNGNIGKERKWSTQHKRAVQYNGI